MTRKGARRRKLYIRINKKWISIGEIDIKGNVYLPDYVDTILEQAYNEYDWERRHR